MGLLLRKGDRCGKGACGTCILTMGVLAGSLSGGKRRSGRWMRGDEGEVRPRLEGGTEVERGDQVEKEKEGNREEGM